MAETSTKWIDLGHPGSWITAAVNESGKIVGALSHNYVATPRAEMMNAAGTLVSQDHRDQLSRLEIPLDALQRAARGRCPAPIWADRAKKPDGWYPLLSRDGWAVVAKHNGVLACVPHAKIENGYITSIYGGFGHPKNQSTAPDNASGHADYFGSWLETLGGPDQVKALAQNAPIRLEKKIADGWYKMYEDGLHSNLEGCTLWIEVLDGHITAAYAKINDTDKDNPPLAEKDRRHYLGMWLEFVPELTQEFQKRYGPESSPSPATVPKGEWRKLDAYTGNLVYLVNGEVVAMDATHPDSADEWVLAKNSRQDFEPNFLQKNYQKHQEAIWGIDVQKILDGGWVAPLPVGTKVKDGWHKLKRSGYVQIWAFVQQGFAKAVLSGNPNAPPSDHWTEYARYTEVWLEDFGGRLELVAAIQDAIHESAICTTTAAPRREADKHEPGFPAATKPAKPAKSEALSLGTAAGTAAILILGSSLLKKAHEQRLKSQKEQVCRQK